jgi:hypothetical protein
MILWLTLTRSDGDHAKTYLFLHMQSSKLASFCGARPSQINIVWLGRAISKGTLLAPHHFGWDAGACWSWLVALEYVSVYWRTSSEHFVAWGPPADL